MRREHRKLACAQLARVTSTHPLMRRLRLRIKALGSPVNKGDLLPTS